MNRLTLTLTATIIASAPVVTMAASSDPLADQCFKAFETKLSQKFTPAPKVQDTRLLGSPIHAGYEPINVTQYTMTATNPKTHAEVLKASCVVNSAGGVVSLKEIVPGSL